MPASPRRAEPPRIPQAPSTESERRRSDDRTHELRHAELRERRSMVRGLALLAVLVLVLSIARAGLQRVFPHGWWRP